MGNVTMKSTKQEIYDELMKAKEKTDEIKKEKFVPLEDAKEKQIMAAIDSADKSMEEGLFSDELKGKYNDTKIAIKAVEDRLKEMYGIEKDMAQIATVVNAGFELRKRVEIDSVEIQSKYRALTRELEEKFVADKKKIEDELREYKDELKRMDRRDEDEYIYKRNRQRRIEEDKWNDSMIEREAELNKKVEEADRLLAESNAKVDYIKEMEELEKGMPARIAQAREQGFQEGKTSADKSNEYKTRLRETETEYKEKDMQNQIDRLAEDLRKANTSLENVQEKLDKAYEEMRVLATKTVESNGSLKVINSLSGDNRK